MPRKEKKFHFIYKTTNNLSGKYYIGMHSTDNLEDGYLGSGKRLRYSINKYGKDKHSREILEFLDSRKELKKREEEIVNLNEIAKFECMNLKVGGEGGLSSGNHLINWRNGMSKGGKKNHRSAYNIHLFKLKNDKDHRTKNSKAISNGLLGNTNTLGLNHSDESKKKMSESGKGSKNSQFGTCWIYNDVENRKIKKEEIGAYLKSGWTKGRKLKR